MADLHPTELGCAFQGGMAPEARLTETRPADPHPPQSSTGISSSCSKLLRSKNIRRHTRCLKRAARYLEELKTALAAHERYASSQRAASLCLPPLPPEGGEYRLFYVSPEGLKFESECLQRHNAANLTDVLHLSASILDSYCGLIRNEGRQEAVSGDVLLSMGTVLQTALRAILDSEALHNILKPAKI